MADILKPNFGPRPREAVCTGSVPSDNLRDLAPDDDAFGDAMAALGLGKSIPHHPRSTRVAVKTLRELHNAIADAVDNLRASALHRAAAEDHETRAVDALDVAAKLLESIPTGPGGDAA